MFSQQYVISDIEKELILVTHKKVREAKNLVLSGTAADSDGQLGAGESMRAGHKFPNEVSL